MNFGAFTDCSRPTESTASIFGLFFWFGQLCNRLAPISVERFVARFAFDFVAKFCIIDHLACITFAANHSYLPRFCRHRFQMSHVDSGDFDIFCL